MRIFRTLSSRLLAAMLAASVTAFSANFWLVRSQLDTGLSRQAVDLEKLSDAKFATDMHAHAGLAAARLESQVETIGRRIEAISERADTLAAIQSFNVAAIEGVLGPAARNADVDSIVVVDTQMAPIGDSANTVGLVGSLRNLRNHPLGDRIRTMMSRATRGSGQPLNEMVQTTSDLRAIFGLPLKSAAFQIVAVPVYGEFGDTSAALIAIRSLRWNEATIRKFSDITHATTIIGVGGTVASISGVGSPGMPRAPSDGSLLWHSADDQMVGSCIDTFGFLRTCVMIPVMELYAARDQLLETGLREGEQLGRRLFWLSLGSVLIFAVAAILLARQITRPLQRITVALSAVSRGEYNVGVPHSGRTDEVGDMARAVVVLKESVHERDQLRKDAIEHNLKLQAQEAELRRQNVLFDAALNNMSHGLCMFNAEGQLIVHNQRFVDLYHLKASDLTVGITADRLAQLQTQVVQKTESDLPAEEFFEGGGAFETRLNKMFDGRSIEVVHQPMANGGWLNIHEDVTERKRSEARIVQMASQDSLTGLPNRLVLRQRMESELARGRRGGGGFAVLCLDLDEFKTVNDTMGHPSGDQLLRQVAKRLLAMLRRDDLVARLGGDEFAIILSGPGARADVDAYAQTIIREISRSYLIDGHEVVIGTSIGIALAPIDGSNPDELLKRADLALYRAKSDGKAGACFFAAQMESEIRARHDLINDMHQALQRSEFEPYFQPQIDLSTNRIAGFEALIRWHHPTRGMVSPMEFIPLAEETGLITQIGDWILRRSCEIASRWPTPLRIAVNVSPRQLRSNAFVTSVTEALAISGLDPQRLELEITESALLDEDAETRNALMAIKSLGVRISMDDFGTGYSSLSCLRSFPFDKIKIDQSFVRTMEVSPQSRAIVSAILDLAHNLKISTTAEGVESASLADLLREEGCSEAQGYLFGAPQPASVAAGLIDGFIVQSSRFKATRGSRRGLSTLS